MKLCIISILIIIPPVYVMTLKSDLHVRFLHHVLNGAEERQNNRRRWGWRWRWRAEPEVRQQRQVVVECGGCIVTLFTRREGSGEYGVNQVKGGGQFGKRTKLRIQG